jgi:hypothetical protein
MKVHIIYHCPYCGSKSFRLSAKLTHKDWVLRSLDFYPQRCYICRGRFYLFQPAILKTVLADSDPAPSAPGLKPLEAPPLAWWDT